jgi:hypothetical protein
MKDDKILTEVFDDCLERLTLGGETVEQCLARYPEQAEALAPLLRTATAVKRVALTSPRPEFRAQARAQFQVALREAASRRKPSFFSFRFPQWAAAVSVVAVVSLGGGGTVVAANQSLPDSPLYAMKLATEEMRLNLTTSSLGKADLEMQLANRRVNEIVIMAEDGNSEGVLRATAQLNSNLIGVAGELGVSVNDSGGTSGTALVQSAPGTAVSRSGADAAMFSTTAMTATNKGVTATDSETSLSENATMGVAAAPAAASPATDTLPAPEIPMTGGVTLDPEQLSLQLSLLQSQAANLEQLYLRLEQATDPSVQAALLQAIAVSQTGYQRALEALAQP